MSGLLALAVLPAAARADGVVLGPVQTGPAERAMPRPCDGERCQNLSKVDNPRRE
jgi:hypothetical protein